MAARKLHTIVSCSLYLVSSQLCTTQAVASRGAKAGEGGGAKKEETQCTVVSWMGSWNRTRALVRSESSLDFS